MIFSSLTLENFRVFNGRHTIDLNSNASNPIVLFGGLNGAGKTSILNAIRLVLFGKMSFEGVTSNKRYERELIDLIHKSENNKPTFASVELAISYSKLGSNYEYIVTRDWGFVDDKLKEKLTIRENGVERSELDNTQSQNFLFSLIPPGIADLFFFDGEKIKSMADDEDGHALIEALKKLVGIDLIDRSISNASYLIRQNKKVAVAKAERDKIDEMEKRFEDIEKQLEIKSNIYENECLLPVTELKARLQKTEQKLSESGGSWAANREQLIKQQAQLDANKSELKIRINEHMRGSVVFSYAPNFMKGLQRQLSKDLAISKANDFNQQIESKLANIKLSDYGESSKINKLLEALKDNNLEDSSMQVSSYQYHQFENTINGSVKAKEALRQMLKKYDQLEIEIEEIGLNISRAPDESLLINMVEDINEIKLSILKINNKTEIIKSEIRSLLKESIVLTYSLEKAYKSAQGDVSKSKVGITANKVIDALASLSNDLMQGKITKLEREFNTIFTRLTRKEDMSFSVRINRDNFQIELVDKHNNAIDKKLISSGEKQIYALSMLEALGKVSGKNLPFIIDTPLGRLDSKHRSKLVNNFFPVIGEQVIILSTDTEVDERFYTGLAPFVNTAYEIKYEEGELSSLISSGYFWKNSNNKEPKVELLA